MVRNPVTPIGGRGPDNHRIQKPTVSAYTLYGGHSCTLDSRTSVLSHVILTYKDFDRAWYG